MGFKPFLNFIDFFEFEIFGQISIPILISDEKNLLKVPTEGSILVEDITEDTIFMRGFSSLYINKPTLNIVSKCSFLVHMPH